MRQARQLLRMTLSYLTRLANCALVLSKEKVRKHRVRSPQACPAAAEDSSMGLEEAVYNIDILEAVPSASLVHYVFTLRFCSVNMLFMCILLPFLTLVASQQNIQDPVASFCRSHQHQTCVIDSKMYVDGGEVYYGGEVESSS